MYDVMAISVSQLSCARFLDSHNVCYQVMEENLPCFTYLITWLVHRCSQKMELSQKVLSTAVTPSRQGRKWLSEYISIPLQNETLRNLKMWRDLLATRSASSHQHYRRLFQMVRSYLFYAELHPSSSSRIQWTFNFQGLFDTIFGGIADFATGFFGKNEVSFDSCFLCCCFHQNSKMCPEVSCEVLGIHIVLLVLLLRFWLLYEAYGECAWSFDLNRTRMYAAVNLQS